MDMQKSIANLMKRPSGGFSAVELVITATVLTIVTGLGLMGISRARASIRISGAAREYATYIEKARLFSIRSHADDAGDRATITINDDKSSYEVTMDLDGDGDLDTKTISLPDGVLFETVETIAFDWRGRTHSTVGGITSANAQVSIRLIGPNDSVSIDVTGSGDITIDSKVFDDSVPNVSLNVGDLASGATPTSTPNISATPEASPVPTPDSTTDPQPTPTPIGEGGDTDPLPTPTPTATATPTPTPTPTATPTPTPTATPTPTPSPSVCTIKTDSGSLIMGFEGTKTIKVSHDSSTSLAITGMSSKPSELQVTPGTAQLVGPGSAATFTIKSKKSLGIYSVTFTSSCGSKTVGVVVLL
jgi:Tfp pilus assembly protein FimT